MSAEVYDPNRRQHYSFRREGEDLIVDIRVAPGGDGPLHFHPVVEERWTVQEGRMRFRIGRRRLIARPGEEYVVAPGVKHAFKNVGKTEARARAVVRPPQEMQEFLEEAAALAREGLYTRLGAPTGLKAAARMAQFVERYRDVAVVCWPPRPFQRLLLGPAKLLARG